MMTDAEKRTMRDSVRGMPLAQASALPIYDNVRGLRTSGVAAEEYYAILDGAVPGPHVMSDAEAKAEAARDHMIDSMNNQWRQPVNDNAKKPHEFARDGRRLADMAPVDRAYEEMVLDMNSWRDR